MKLTDVLYKIADTFNENNITWAVGGSLLLFYYDILETPKDIDIIIKPSDQEKVFSILKHMGNEKQTKEVENYKTGVFGKFDINGIEVDIIGDFYIKSTIGYYLHPFPPKELKFIDINNTKIFLDSIENWLDTYRAMGDPKNRVELINEYLNS